MRSIHKNEKTKKKSHINKMHGKPLMKKRIINLCVTTFRSHHIFERVWKYKICRFCTLKDENEKEKIKY